MRCTPEKAQQRGCGTSLYRLPSFLWLCNTFIIKRFRKEEEPFSPPELEFQPCQLPAGRSENSLIS